MVKDVESPPQLEDLSPLASLSIPNCLFERIRNEIILQKLLSDPFDALFFSSNCFVQKSNLNRLFFLSAQTVDRLLLPHKINLDKSRKLFRSCLLISGETYVTGTSIFSNCTEEITKSILFKSLL